MKNHSKNIACIIFLYLVTLVTGSAENISEENKIKTIISSYEQALNSANTEKIEGLFSKDGVLVLQGSPASVGIDDIKAFYNSLFKTLNFNLKFNIKEVVYMSPDWAFVKTTTSGTVKLLASNFKNKGDGHEFFILKKQNGDWKIDQYSGSSSKNSVI
mgnify:CR=1 FL=1